MIRQRHKTNQSVMSIQNHSIQQSPIYASSHHQSDHSPEPFIYPTSLERKVQLKIPRYLNLKVEVINLLSKLKQWLIELCLTENCVAEVCQQLGPIIEQIVELGEQNEQSYWVETRNPKQSQIGLIQSQNIFISSGVSEPFRHCSVLMSDSRAEVALLGEGQKNLVKLYFKRYYRLFENSIGRINRCSGQKKLKFLVDTVSRNIFSETMRVSYDLKLVEHRLKQQRRSRMATNKGGYTRLIGDRVRMIFQEQGGLKWAFTRMRTDYIEGLKRDGSFVNSMLKNLDKLCGLYQRNRKWGLTRQFYSWRQTAIQRKFDEQCHVTETVRNTVQNILPALAPQGSRQEFCQIWRISIQNQLNSMLESLFLGSNCVFVSLREVVLQPGRQGQWQEEMGTYRSDLCRDHPFLGQFTLEELRNCVLSGQICRSQRQANSLLLVPIKAAAGIIFAELASQGQSTLSFSRRPMTLQEFRRLLRVVELLAPVLEDVSGLCIRVEQQWQSVDRLSYHQLLFRQFLKTDLLCSSGPTQSHLQISERGQEGLAIDSHRLISPDSVINEVLNTFSITNLMIYHTSEGTDIQQSPCIVIGQKEIARTYKNIINSIYNELINSGKQILTIARNGNTFYVLPLRNEGKMVGLIHYSSLSEEKVDNSVIMDNLVPLIMKYDGSIDCKKCNVQLTLPKPFTLPKQIQSQKLTKLNFQNSIKLVYSQNINSLQKDLIQILLNQQYLFQKLVFRLDLSDPLNYYTIDSQSSKVQFITLPQGQRITHTDIFIEQNLHMTDGGTFAKLVFSSPCFSNSQLHIYQNQNIRAFRMVALPIKNNQKIFGYWLVGHFLSDNSQKNEDLLNLFKNIVEVISTNRIFIQRSLQDDSLSQELNQDLQQKQEKFENILNFIDKWKGEGKLCHQLSQFTQKFLQEKQFKENVKFTVFKTFQTQQSMVVLHSNKSRNGVFSKQAKLDMIQFLKTCDILMTHQKLMANTCELVKLNTKRTIRPMKLQKLNQTNIFFPKVNENIRKDLLKKVKEIYQLQGWVSTEYLSMISNLNSRLFGGQNQSNESMFILLNLSLKQQPYYCLVQIKETTNLIEKQLLNNQILRKMQLKLMIIIEDSRFNKPSLKERGKTILKFMNLLEQKTSITLSVNKFRQNLIYNKRRAIKLQAIISALVFPEQSKNKRYLNLINGSFVHLRLFSYWVQRRYRCLIMRIEPVLEQIIYRNNIQIGFNQVVCSILEPCSFNQVRSCSNLSKTLTKIILKIAKYPIVLIKKFTQYEKSNSIINKKKSSQKIMYLIERLDRYKNKYHFFNQINKLSESFETHLSLISNEFSHIHFNSREQLLKFSNERFSTILNHSNFGLLTKVQIFCAQKLSNSKVIYKINQQGQFQQCIDSSFLQNVDKRNDFLKISIQSKKHQNCHLLLCKITTKTGDKAYKQMKIIKSILNQGLVPCYSRYINAIENRAQQISNLLLRIYCKQIWNGSCNQPQRIYALGRDFCTEQQCQKLRVISTLKSLKQVQKIFQTKMITNAINDQSKILYNLQYEFSALTGAISGNLKNLNELQKKTLYKYGEVINRQQLKQAREQADLLEMEQQKKMLQYQIKSKTFATSQIITFLQKRENIEVQNISYRYLNNINGKENNRYNHNIDKNVENVYVQKKLELTKAKQKLIQCSKNKKKMAARTLWLILSRIARFKVKKQKKVALETLLLPKRVPLKALY